MQYTLERRIALWDRTHAGMDNKESGTCEHSEKGWVVFPNVILSIDSQLLLGGLPHLYFSVKIAPVIIYLAWTSLPALCFWKMASFTKIMITLCVPRISSQNYLNATLANAHNELRLCLCSRYLLVEKKKHPSVEGKIITFTLLQNFLFASSNYITH